MSAANGSPLRSWRFRYISERNGTGETEHKDAILNPAELKYAETHEWVSVSDGVATIGISDFAIKQLTDLVFMELPEVGKTVSAGDSIGEIESVKAVSDMYSPVDGEVIEVNGALPDNLETLNNDPYGEGWAVKIKIADESGLAKLMDHAAYVQQCASEG